VVGERLVAELLGRPGVDLLIAERATDVVGERGRQRREGRWTSRSGRGRWRVGRQAWSESGKEERKFQPAIFLRALRGIESLFSARAIESLIFPAQDSAK
jgi:hypothetical protein